MPQLKKLMFDHDVSDEKGDIWKFNFRKTAAIAAFILVIFILIYGFLLASDSHKFFSDVIFYVSILIAAAFALLLIVGSITKARQVLGRFLLILICLIGAYGILGFIWSAYFWNFYMGYSTWIVLTVLAGFGATRKDDIFNGNLDRHDLFYVSLIFIVFVSANMPIVQGAGFLERLDGMIAFFMDKASLFNWRNVVNETTNQT